MNFEIKGGVLGLRGRLTRGDGGGVSREKKKGGGRGGYVSAADEERAELQAPRFH